MTITPGPTSRCANLRWSREQAIAAGRGVTHPPTFGDDRIPRKGIVFANREVAEIDFGTFAVIFGAAECFLR